MDAIRAIDELVGQLQEVPQLIATARWEDAGTRIQQHDAALRLLLDDNAQPEQRTRLAGALRRVLECERWVLGELARARDATAEKLVQFHRGRTVVRDYLALGHG